jgi:hypothetical protein
LSKAQLFTADTFIALSIFIVILISMAWSWNTVTERIAQQNTRIGMEIFAKNAMSLLVETLGSPTDWPAEQDINNIVSLGLANAYPSALASSKLLRLQELNSNYTDVKRLLGLQGYGFHLQVYVYNGTAYPETPSYDIGNASSGAGNVAILSRNALLDDEWAMLRLEVWK